MNLKKIIIATTIAFIVSFGITIAVNQTASAQSKASGGVFSISSSSSTARLGLFQQIIDMLKTRIAQIKALVNQRAASTAVSGTTSGTTTCTATTTCASLGYICGTPSNGCGSYFSGGGFLDCGLCEYGKTCVGGKCQPTVLGADGKECFTITPCSTGYIACPDYKCRIFCNDGDSGKYPNWSSTTTNGKDGVTTYCGTPVDAVATAAKDKAYIESCNPHVTCTSCECPSSYASLGGGSPINLLSGSITTSCTAQCETCCVVNTTKYNCTTSSQERTIRCYKQ